MEYTVKKMAQLSGVSGRTLRYYDEIALLKPTRISSSGYRIYGKKEVDRLQQILYYRELELSLGDIKAILDQPNFNVEHALAEHYQRLLAEKDKISRLLENIAKTMKYYKGEITMSDKEKFAAFKEQKVAENEAKYGKEIRENYGESEVEQSNQKYLDLTEKEMEEMAVAQEQLFEKLSLYLKQPLIKSPLAQEIFELHKKWLSYTSPTYSAEFHKGLGAMYVADERFKAYYNSHEDGMAEALNEIIQHYA